MSVIRRFNKPQGLKDIDVLIEDDAPISIFFNVVEVPEVISQGKSSFLIGGSNLLKPEVEIKFEITNDDSGAVIYTEPVSGYLEGTSRRVSVEVYDDVDLFGDATLTIVGELNPQNQSVPPEFQDTYNVRYTRKIYISSAGVNTQPILFYNQPRIVVTEIVKPYITTTFPTASITKTGGATGTPIETEIGKTTNVENDEEPAKFVKKLKNNLRFKLFGGGGNNAFVRRGRRRARRASPEVDKFTITNKSGDKFDARFVGGEIQIPNPQVDTSKFTLEPFHEVPAVYKSDVENVKNEDTLVPEKPFTIIDTRFDEDDPQRNVIVPLATENLTYTASMESVPTQSISTVNFRSYADIRLSKLRTFSGDIDRVKVYARNKDAFGDFEMVSDQQIESPELLFNVFGAGNQRIGFFLNQEHINQYWVSSSNATITSDSSYLLNAARISGSNQGVNSFVTFEQTGSLPISYTKDTEYNISFNAIGFKGNKNTVGGSGRSGRLGIFVSGSGFRVNHEFGNDLGFQLEVNNQPAFLNVTAGEQEDFGSVAEIFSPQVNGNGVLKLVVFSGEFYVSDVSINPATATGFSPNFVQIIAPVPPLTQERPDDYEFFAEFYDVNNNVAESVVFASSSTFVGGNSYIAGGDNLLSGSMFIGSAISAGIEMAGVSSGFIRSLGYHGFSSGSGAGNNAGDGTHSGFLMFSGSVLPDSGDNYKGVGLELVGNSGSFFKFRTDPSELDIRTDAFFIGQESIQFLSGSDGNIEISSSLFHLDPKNELLVIGADAVINADLTVNNLRTPAQIGGAPSTEQNASASISSQGFAAFRSASIGGFDVDETTISSTDDSLILKSSGQITGSSTLLGNKSAGQFLQFKDSTLTVQGNITADNIRTPATIGGAPSTDANASSSITADGLATFKSGSIAGWKIFGNKLSGSNATLDAEGAALYKSDQGPNTDTSAPFDQLRNEYYIDFTPTGSNSSNFYIKMGPNFGVDKDGVLFASGAVFEGSITASSGKIGGFSIETSSLSGTNIFISGSPLQGGVDDPRYMFISTSKFNVKEDGDVTGSNVLFDGGKIAGWTINSTNLTSPGAGIRLNANGDNSEISINSHTFANEGIQLGFNGGSPRFYAGDGAQNFLRYDTSNGVSVKTTRFELDATNLELSSTEASMSLGEGKIILQGASTSTIKVADKFLISADGTDEFLAIGNKTSFTHFDQSTAGLIMGMDGSTSKFEVSADANNYLSFNGTGLDIKAGTFDLATSTMLLDSGTNSGKISLGATPPTTHASGTGFYVDGTGKFLVGNTGGNFIQFNGTQIILKSPDFFLGDTNNFLSGSNGNISIQTDAFELDATGVEISSTHASMSLGTGNELLLRGGTNSPFISLQPAAALVDKTYANTGVFFGVAGGATPLFSAVGSGGHFKFNGSSIDISTDTAVISGSSIQLVTPTFLLGSVSQNNFISGSNGNMKINSDNFELDASNLELSSTQASMSLGEGKIVLQGGGTSTITVGASNSIKLSDDGTDRFLVIGSKTSFSHFNQSTAGFIVGTDSGTTKFELVGDSNNYISFDGSKFDVALQEGLELDATNIEISSLNASMSIGETSSGGKAIKLAGASTSGQILVGSETNKQVEIFGNHAKGYIRTGKTSVSDTTEGFWFANNNANPEFHIGDATDFIKLQNGDLDIASQKLEISASTIQISTNEASMSFGHSSTYPQGKLIMEGSGTPTFKMGPDVGIISMTTGSGIYMDGDGNFRFGDDDGHIKFQSGVFSITGSDVNINVDTIDIQTNAFELSSTHASMSLGTNRQWKAFGGDASPYLSIGQAGNGVYGNSGVFLGYNSGGSAPRVSFVGSSGHFKFTGTDLDIKTGTLELDATNIEISSTNASMSLGEGNLLLDGGNSKIEVGSANKVTIQGGSTDNFITMGSKSSFTHFNQSTQGIIIGMDSTVPKLEMVGNATNYLSFDGTNFDIKLSEGLELDANNIELSSTHASMSLGEGKIKLVGGSTSTLTVGASNSIKLSDDGTDRFLVIGSKTSFSHFNQSTAGLILGTDNGTTKFELVGNSTNYLSFDGSNFDIKLSEGLELDASNIELSSTHASMSLGEGKIKLIGGSTSTLTIGSSNSIKLSDDGTDRFLVIGSKSSFSHFDQSTAGFIVGTDGGTTKFELVGSATNYLSFDGTNFDVKLSQGLELDANNIEISSTHASMSLGSSNDINLDGVNKKITIGSANAVTIQGGGTDNFMVMGSKTSFTHFDKSTAGIIVGMDSTVPKFEIVGNSSNYLSFNGTNFDIALSQGLELDASNIELSSTHASMSIGDTNPIILQSIGSDRVLRFGSKTDFGQTTTAGFIMGIDNGVPKLDFTVGTGNDNFFRIDSSGVDFSSDTITINTDRFKITSTAGNERIRFFSGSNEDAGRVTGAGEFVRIGEVSDDASDLYGLKIYDGTGTGSADTLVKLGQDGNEIAGWTITNDRLSGGQMIIRNDGTIESSGFASDVAGSGFRLTAADGGFLEVENAKIRGTMATAVFEKESVNAVGGQLYVANSTTLTGSSFPTTLAGSGRTLGNYPANETTMSVENVTGFVQGEILSLKKVTDSGFSTEYVFVNSASRQNPSSENDFSGQLYVTRGYGSGISGDSGSLGDTPSSAQAYSGSQVIVSTGRYISGNAPNTVGSGYIRMNANPADPTTPYIDIIERTGSGIYDVGLKARLGDLSGLSSGLLYGETNPGFGLFTENVFLQGGITATTGSITGKLFVDTTSSQKMIFGIGVDGGSNDGIFINANNYWYTNGAFKVGSATYNLQNDSSGNISISPKTFELDATNIEISSTNASMSLGEGNLLLDGANSKMTIGSTNKITIQGGASDNFIAMGNKSSFSNEGSGTAGILIGMDSTNPQAEFVKSSENYFIFDGGSGVDIKTTNFELAANTDDLQISATHKSMSLANNKILLDGGGNVGYVRVGSSTTYDDNINISGSATQAIIKAGKTSFTDTTNAGFVLEKTNSDSRFFVGDSNSVNQIKFDTSGGVDIKTQKLEVDAGDIEISSTHASMSLGQGKIDLVGGSTSTITIGASNSLVLSDDGTDRFLAIGKSNFSQFDQSTEGIILGTDNGTAKFEIAKNSANYLSYDGSNFDIKLSQGFELDATNLEISSTNASMSLGEGKIRAVGGSTSTITIGSSNSITLSDDGTDRFIAIGKSGFSQFNQSTAGFIVGTDNGTTKFELVGSANNYVSFNGSTFDMKLSQGFDLAVNTDDLQISSTQKSMSLAGGNVLLDGAQTTGYIRVGSATQRNNNINISGSNTLAVIKAGITGSYADGTSAGDNGFILERNLTSTKFHVGSGTEYIRFDGTNIDIAAANFSVTASDVNISAGNSISIDTPDFELSSTQKSMSLGYDTNGDVGINIVGGDPSTIFFGSKTSPPLKLVADDQSGINEYYLSTNNKAFGDTTAGVIIGSDAGVQKLELYKDADEFFTYNTTDGFDLRTTKIDLTTGQGLTISGRDGSTAANNKILLGSATTVDAGEGIFMDGGGNFRVGDATSGGTNFLKFTSSGTLTIKSENIDITSTAFELNANSGDLQLSSTHKSMSLASQKIILEGDSSDGSLKIGGVSSVTDTTGANKGFYAEGDGDFIAKAGANKYIQFNGGDLDVKTDKLQIDATDFEVSSTEASMSLGEGKIRLVGASTSTITVGSSNPITISDDGTDRFVTIGKSNFSQFDQSTEGIIFGTDNGNAKFEVAADGNNYLSFDGSSNSLDIAAQTFNLNASTLKVSSNSSGSIALGASPPTTYSTGTGFFVDGAGNLLLGSTSGNFIQFGASSGALTIKSQVFSLFTSTIVIDSSVNDGKISLGSSPNTSVGGTNKGVYMDGTGDFLVRGNADNFLKFDAGGNTLEIKSDTFDLDAGTIIMDSAGSGVMKLGSSASSITETANTGVFIDGGGKFRVGGPTSGDNFIHFDGSSIIMKSPDFFLGDATNHISGSGGTMNIKSVNFELDAGNLEISSANVSMSLGEGKIKMIGGSTSTIAVGTSNGLTLSDDGTDRFLVMGSKTSFSHFDQSTAGIILGTDNNTPKFEIAKDGNNYISFGGTTFDIKLSQGFELDATNLELSSTNASMSLGEGKIILEGASTSTIKVADKFIISSDGTDEFLAIGTKTSFTHFNQSTAGVIMGMDGSTAKFEVAADANNYLSFNGSNIDIKTSNFNLTGTSGTIGLGTLANATDTDDTSTGFHVDSSGNVLIKAGGADSQYLRAGSSQLIMKSSDFFLGDTSNFVSSSGGNFEISSSNFHLATNGNVTMAGIVRASTGFIGGSGGWTIGSGKLTSNTGDIALDGGAGDIIVGSGANIVRLSSTSTAAISAGATNPTDAPFQVDFGGAVTASAGQIAGFIIETGAISSSLSTLVLDSTIDSGRGAIMGGSQLATHPKASDPTPADNKSGFFLGSTGVFVGESDGAFFRFKTTAGANNGLTISGSNFSVSSSGLVEATDMILDGDIVFKNDSGLTIGKFGAVSMTSAAGSGLDVGMFSATTPTQGVVAIRSSVPYEGVVIEGSSTRWGSNTTQQIAMGLDYINSDQGIINFDHSATGTGLGGLNLFTYHDSSGTPNAHSATDVAQWVRLQPKLSGSVSILESGVGGSSANTTGVANGGYLNIGTSYNSTIQATLGYAVYIYSDTMINANLWVYSGTGEGSLGVGAIGPSGTTGEIHASADIVAFASSDIKLKENINPIQDALFKVRQLRGIEFDWKELDEDEKKKIHSHEGHDVGVIAQEVEKVLPEVVQTRENGYKAVKYEKMIPLLIESIKEQQEQIEELKKEVEELKNGSTS